MSTPRPSQEALASTTARRPFATVGRQAALPLLAGTAGFIVLWVVGAREHGWLAFVLAALAPSLTSAPRGDNVSAQESTHRAPATGHYTFCASDSTIQLTSRKLGLVAIRSHLDVEGRVDLAEPIGDSSVTARIPMGSFRSFNPVRDRHVLGPGLLDAYRHPKAVFTSTSVAGTPGDLEVKGTLELHGRSRPVTLTGSIRAAGTDEGDELLVVDLRGELSRGAFGVDRFRWLVSDHTDVAVRVAAAPEGRS